MLGGILASRPENELVLFVSHLFLGCGSTFIFQHMHQSAYIETYINIGRFNRSSVGF